jgi:hypothetical protein
MAKTARKTKSRKTKARKSKARSKTKPRKAKVRKKAKASKKSVARKKTSRKKASTRTRRAGARAASATEALGAPLAAEAMLGVATRASVDKRIAVIRCVNKFMDANHRGWNADLQGDSRKFSDYHEPPQNVPLIVGAIRKCLETTYSYTFPSSNALVAKCIAGNLGDVKFEIADVTIPK